jgi:hypothetical protein
MPEGQVYLGATNVTTDAGGNVSFSVLLPFAAPSNAVVTATATDPGGNTSEFSFASALTTGPQSVALSIARSGNTEIVSWPSVAAAFQLQAAGSAKSPIPWQTISNGISDNGTWKSYVVTNGPGVTNQIFRLKK